MLYLGVNVVRMGVVEHNRTRGTENTHKQKHFNDDNPNNDLTRRTRIFQA